MKKVVFITTSLNAGGIENYLLRFLQSAQVNFIPIVVCKSWVFGDLLEKYQKIENIQLVKLKIGYFDFRALYSLSRMIKEKEIETVCDFTGNFAGLPLFVAKLAGVEKRIAFYRGSTNHFKEDYFRLFYNWGMKLLVKRCATNILSNSLAALNYFYPDRDTADHKFEVIHNGLDSEEFCSEEGNLRNDLNIPNDSFVIGHVGRYNVAKNHKTIIQVAFRLCKSNPHIFFILCGAGVDENLNESVKTAGLEHQIRLLGYRSDVSRVLNTFDVFYFPSITEGQPNALIEAMVKGLPFVASNINPILETVPPHLYRQLVDPLDVVGAANRLLAINLLKDRSLLICSDWAKQKYSASSCFELFLKKL